MILATHGVSNVYVRREELRQSLLRRFFVHTKCKQKSGFPCIGKILKTEGC